MTMDQRHTQIEEGAGLTESKLNVEFVDFLRKYSTPILLVVTLIALAYVGWDRYQKHRQTVADDAWGALESAVESRSPGSLLAVAEEHAGVLGLPLIARNEAADILLQFAMLGLTPGAQLLPTGEVKDTADVLSPEQKTQQLERAAAEYQRVVDATEGNQDLVLHRIKALFGLAAVDETRGQFDAAKGRYEQIIEASKWAALPALGDAATQLIDTMDLARTSPPMFAGSQVVTRPPPPPQPPGATPNLQQIAPPVVVAPELGTTPAPDAQPQPEEAPKTEPAPQPAGPAPATPPPATPEKPAEDPKGQ